MDCNHDYRVVYDNLDIVQYKNNDKTVEIDVSGFIIFHCTRCLDVQKKVIS